MVVAALAHIYPDLNRVIQNTPTKRAGDAKRLGADDHHRAVLQMAKKDVGDYLDRRSTSPPMPEVQRVFDTSNSAPSCRPRRY